MVDNIIDHFRDAIVPHIQYVIWQLTEPGKDVYSPHPIFFERLAELVLGPPGNQRMKSIRAISRSALGDKRILVNQSGEVPVDCLARNAKFFSCQSNNVFRMCLDTVEYEVPYFLSLDPNTSHGRSSLLSTLLVCIVNIIQFIVNIKRRRTASLAARTARYSWDCGCTEHR